MIPLDFYKLYDFQSNLILGSLIQKHSDLFESKSENLHVKRGNALFYENGIPTGVFLIINGRAKKLKRMDGGEQIFYLYKEGDLLGYHAVLSNERYQDSCEALDELDVKFISKDNFFQLVDTIPEIRDSLIKNLSHEFGVLANIIGLLAQKSQNKRLAVFLLVLANRFKKPGVTNVIDLSREDLANIIGTTRVGISRSLKDLKFKGLIRINKRKIFLEDKLGLFELAKG